MRNIIGILLLAFLIGGSYYIWTHRYDYFFKGGLETNDADEQAERQEQDEFEGEDNIEGEFIDEEDHDENELTGDEGESLEEIVAQDCEQGCENKKGQDGYEYCLEICGITETVNVSGCDSLSGLKKDSCYRGKAIVEKSFEFCDKISDDNLKKACHNRVLEEIVDAQSGF